MIRSARWPRLAVLFTALFAAGNALACSCAESNLEWHFESSPHVFTAVVTGARFDSAGDIEADYEVTEVFKGDPPFDKLRTTRGGTSCDTSITVGPEYLFFMGEEGRFGMCSGNRTIVPGRPDPWVGLLRAYKAGETPDLSSPWQYGQHDGSCRLATDFRTLPEGLTSYLELEFRYRAPADPVWTIPELNQPGYSRATFMLPTSREPAGSEIVIEVRDRRFVATWTEQARPMRSRGAFQLRGEAVREFARALKDANEVQLEGSLRYYPTIDGTRIRTTNAGTAIDQFVDCTSR